MQYFEAIQLTFMCTSIQFSEAVFADVRRPTSHFVRGCSISMLKASQKPGPFCWCSLALVEEDTKRGPPTSIKNVQFGVKSDSITLLVERHLQ